MKIKYQADNDLDERIVRAVLRLDEQIDFQTAPALGLHGVPAPEVLRMAAAEDRILVSHDLKTMPYHFADFIAQQNSPGVFLISPKLSISEAADWLHLIWAASEAEDYVNSIRRIP